MRSPATGISGRAARKQIMSNLAADGFIDEIIECGSGAKRPPAAIRPLIPDVKHELDGGAGVPADRERGWGGIGVFKDEEERAHT